MSLSSGMPVAASGLGFLGPVPDQTQCWPSIWLCILEYVWSQVCMTLHAQFVPDSLLFFWDGEVFYPLSCSQALRYLRNLLTSALSDQDFCPSSYTLHSCKASFLSFMNETGLDRDSRRLQGHHTGGAPELYSREDTIGALRAQRQLCERICGGFVPKTPIARGAQRPATSAPPDLAADFHGQYSLPVMFQVTPLHTTRMQLLRLNQRLP